MFNLIITTPLGFIIEKIYELVNNYGWAIIIFTVIIKFLVLPLTIKSQKAMKKQQKIQPIIQQLQEKYKNDQEKLQTEMLKVYRENDVSMMGGCLPLLIQMPILIGLYQVIQKPLSYIMNVDFNAADAINKTLELRKGIVAAGQNIGNLASVSMEDLANLSQIQLAKWSETLNGSSDPWVINFEFLGMDLASVPSISLSALWNAISTGDFSNYAEILLIIIPVLAVATTWFVSKQSQAMTQAKKDQNKKKTAQEEQSEQMTKSMSLMMPIMTGFFTFTLPSGLGIYWIISNVMQIIQQFCLNKYFDTKEDDFVVKVPEKNRKNSKKRR